MRKIKRDHIQFKVSGTLTRVSKSGKSEHKICVSRGGIWYNIKLVPSFDADCYDILDGNWTIYGVPKKSIKVLFNKSKK